MFLRMLFGVLLLGAISSAPAIPLPAETPTVVVHGFDSSGASQAGTFGLDESDDSIEPLAAMLGLPMSYASPLAKNQVAYTEYYGSDAPPYFTQADRDQLAMVTAQYGGGIPRYAFIVAKYAREVMRRTGTRQINLLGVSMGGLVSRWIVEKDVDGLASSGKIARWIVIEGVVGGSWPASQAGGSVREWMEEYYDLNTIDLEQMRYSWIDANLHNPHNSSSSPFLAQFETHFLIPSDDEYNDYALSLASGDPNDGVQLLEDTFLHNLGSQSLFLGRYPTRSAFAATHESSKQHTGLRAAVAAQLFGRKRVTVRLRDVFIINDRELSAGGDGEYVFGVAVYSPRALADYSVGQPVHELRSNDNNLDFRRLESLTTHTVDITWFDDMVLPGETSLRLETNVDEIDQDLLYDVWEYSASPKQDMSDAVLSISTESPGTYHISTTDWRGVVEVTFLDYPEFEQQTGVTDWYLYK